MTEQEVLKKALRKNGIDMQRAVAIEEMSELTKELCKSKRGLDRRLEIAEEIADVEIMLEQLKMYYVLHNEVQRIRVDKVARLLMRLSAE